MAIHVTWPSADAFIGVHSLHLTGCSSFPDQLFTIYELRAAIDRRPAHRSPPTLPEREPQHYPTRPQSQRFILPVTAL
jgi:hypothetical protein